MVYITPTTEKLSIIHSRSSIKNKDTGDRSCKNNSRLRAEGGCFRLFTKLEFVKCFLPDAVQYILLFR